MENDRKNNAIKEVAFRADASGIHCPGYGNYGGANTVGQSADWLVAASKVVAARAYSEGYAEGRKDGIAHVKNMLSNGPKYKIRLGPFDSGYYAYNGQLFTEETAKEIVEAHNKTSVAHEASLEFVFPKYVVINKAKDQINKKDIIHWNDAKQIADLLSEVDGEPYEVVKVY